MRTAWRDTTRPGSRIPRPSCPRSNRPEKIGLIGFALRGNVGGWRADAQVTQPVCGDLHRFWIEVVAEETAAEPCGSHADAGGSHERVRHRVARLRALLDEYFRHLRRLLRRV